MGADTSTLKGSANNAQLKSVSDFSPGYILKLKERFEMASDDFTLDREALKQYFKCSNQECNILFEHFDMDNNGKIDSYEFICALTMLSHATLEQKSKLIFNLYDFDGSRYITRDELVILMTNSLTSLNSMKKQPAPSIEDIEHKTDDFFKKADIDGDEKITLEEFKNYVTTDKLILEILLNANVAKEEDLGTNFGSGDGVPQVDKDLEAEINLSVQNEDKHSIKEGVDFKVKQSEDGMFEEEEMGEGDQFMAVKPWLGVVENSVPSNYKPDPRDGEAPDYADLQLEHVYGYRCHDTRNNLRYAANGNLVYHAAGVGIVHDTKSNTQKFFLEHHDDIHCLAIDPSGKYCATGEIGPRPWLFIWNNETMECLARIQGTLKKGIMHVAFSHDGKYVAASAMDEEHHIAIYDWQTKPKQGQSYKPFVTGKGTKANILSLGFSPQNDQLIATCVKEIQFFSFDNGVLKGNRGIGWGKSGPESVLCQAFVDKTLVTGSFSGNLILWSGRNIQGKPVKAHEGIVNTLYQRKTKKGVISGGNDGLVIVWSYNGNLAQEKSFDTKVQQIRSLQPKVRSVCEHHANGLILVGTRGGEIVEFGGEKPQIHMRSHCDGELWGLTPHPKSQQFLTIGQDNMLAIWDIQTKRQKKFAKLDCGGNAIAFSNDAKQLAIGFLNGQLTILDENFKVITVRKDRKEEVTEIKYSPNNKICAVGARDPFIYTYDVQNKYKPLKKLKGHHSTVAHFDFSLDSQYLMSNCTSYEILFWDLQSGKQMTGGASQLKDETWNTWTCTLGWPVQGIFPPCANGSDINSCDRSPDMNVVATGDDFGMVKIFRYPCPVEKAAFTQFHGHSSHVTQVRFIPKSPHLISTGGADKSVFQWQYKYDQEGKQEAEQVKEKAEGEEEVDDGCGMFEEEEVGEGDEALAVLPFKGEVEHSYPSDWVEPKNAADPPEGNLKLKYAHGFRSFDTRSNLKYTSTGEVAFTTAALGVILNKEKNTQKFFNLHQDDVVSMAIHPEKDIIATGQMAAKGQAKMIDIFIWSASTQELITQLSGFHRRAIRNLAFSPSGEKLLSIGEDDYHSCAVYDWANKRMICNSKVDGDKVFACEWKDENEFMTCGMKHVKFFSIKGSNLSADKGLYGKIGPTPMTCCNFVLDSKIPCTGTPKGELIQWGGRSTSKVHKGHTDALWQILTIMNGTMILTGANDDKVIMWDKSFNQKKVIDFSPMSQFMAGVRSLDFNEKTKKFLVGTRGAEIIEVDLQSGKKVSTLIYGHFDGNKQSELWGCTVHPKEQIFASCGGDNTLRLWNENKMIKASEKFEEDLTTCDWSSNGKFIVVGDRNGYIHSVDAKTLKKLGTEKGCNAGERNAWIQDLKISPNNKIIATGSHGGRSKIDIIKVLEDGKKIQKYASVDLALTSSLLHLDWSSDSNSIVLNSQAYELMWLDVNSQDRIPASGAKDIDYYTYTCKLGFPVQGIWPGPNFSDVNTTCRSNSRQVLATGDNFGQVKLFKYPCVVEGASFKDFNGHSSHVCRVKFSANDKYVISAGGNDKTLIVWETDFALDDPNHVEEQKEDENQATFEDDEFGFSESHVDKSKIKKQQEKEEEKAKQKKPEEEVDDFFEVEDVGEGDEFMAVKPWIGQMKEPTGFQKPPVNQEKPPQIKLELEWVHGYRSNDTKNNIAYLHDGSIAYHAAAVGIVYDPKEHSQRFFNMHIDDIISIAFSSDKKMVATGEIGPYPSIYLWDGITMDMVHQLKGKLKKGVQSLAFSPSGKYVAGVATDDDHSVAVYNTECGSLVGFSKGDKALILEIDFKNDTEFSTAGVKHFKNWKIGSTLTSTKGSFGKKDQRIGSCKYSKDDCLSGAITGELYVWGGGSIKTTKKLHDRPLDAIHCHKQYVFTGGRDGKVNVLKPGTFDQIFSFTIDNKFASISNTVRALCLSDTGKELLVGTYGAEIYKVQIDMTKKSIAQPQIVTQGHYSPCKKDTNEIWGLAAYPKKEQYVSVSDDATLRIWDTKARKQIKLVKLDIDDKGKEFPLDKETNELSDTTRARAVAISNDEKYCAVGFRDGSLRIYDITQDWKFINSKPLSKTKKEISDLKFSPDGTMLAISAHDTKIFIYNFPSMKGKCILNSSTASVTHMDWSLDSNTLQSNDRSYEILYYNVQAEKQDTSGASNNRDEDWATWTCILGWPVQGIWPSGVDGTDINAVDRSHQPLPDGYRLVASADDFSSVKVFRYPSMVEYSEAVEGKGHSSHVTKVRFSKDDKYLFSAGGNDTCMFQWKVEK